MKSKLRVVFGIGVFAGLAGGFVVSKKCILKSMEKYLQSDECKNEINAFLVSLEAKVTNG